MSRLRIVLAAANEVDAMIRIFEISGQLSEELFDLQKDIEPARLFVKLVQGQALFSFLLKSMASKHPHVEVILVGVCEEVLADHAKDLVRLLSCRVHHVIFVVWSSVSCGNSDKTCQFSEGDSIIYNGTNVVVPLVNLVNLIFGWPVDCVVLLSNDGEGVLFLCLEVSLQLLFLQRLNFVRCLHLV